MTTRPKALGIVAIVVAVVAAAWLLLLLRFFLQLHILLCTFSLLTVLLQLLLANKYAKHQAGRQPMLLPLPQPKLSSNSRPKTSCATSRAAA